MPKPVAHLLILAGLSAAVPAAHATLIGDSVGLRLLGRGDTGVQQVRVGDGAEGSFFGNQIFDIGAMDFSLSSTRNFCGVWRCGGARVALELSSLDFGGSLVDVRFQSNLSGLELDFGADYVTFSWWEQALYRGTYLQAQFQTVREPSTWALLGIGLIVGLVTRGRRSAQIARRNAINAARSPAAS